MNSFLRVGGVEEGASAPPVENPHRSIASNSFIVFIG